MASDGVTLEGIANAIEFFTELVSPKLRKEREAKEELERQKRLAESKEREKELESLRRKMNKFLDSLREAKKEKTVIGGRICCSLSSPGYKVVLDGECRDNPEIDCEFEWRYGGFPYNVILEEPKWNRDVRRRHLCYKPDPECGVNKFGAYIREKWSYTDHEFYVVDIVDSRVYVRSRTIDRALGLEESTPPKTESVKIGKMPNVIVDGSNVIRANDGFSWRTLGALVYELKRRGCNFRLVFDANIKHVLEERNEQQGIDYLERLEKTYSDRFLIVPAGAQADDYVLLLADKEDAHIISCDRYNDEKFRSRYVWLRDKSQPRVHTFAVMGSQLLVPDFDITKPILKSGGSHESHN